LYQPVFYKWFLQQFPEPTAWFRARLAYARTAAVMSIVGYIVGLGDRHGENILFDSSNGDAVHVDFNCLFCKGMTFEKPEKVPFRLTQNMVDALGLTGPEGTFRKVCEITLHLLRRHKETLTSVLETFIHDPLVEWAKPSTNRRAKSDWKAIVDNALSTLKDIEDRLDGKMRHLENRGQILLPLSVEGHVHALIQEATKPENLSAMFLGWASYL